MTFVRQPVQQNLRSTDRSQDARNPDRAGQDGSQVVAHLPPKRDAGEQREGGGKGRQDRPSDTQVNALAERIAALKSPADIERAAQNLRQVARANTIPTDHPLATIGKFARAAVYQRGTLRRMLYSQPLPGKFKVTPGKSMGISISPELRKQLAPFLATRPKRGFGYIIAHGDVLDDLLEEAYDEGRDDDDRFDLWLMAFLQYNRHLGLDSPEALSAAVGQLLYFPQLQEFLHFREQVTEQGPPKNFPALESFLSFAHLPASAAPRFHWVAPQAAAADANLSTFGKGFSFQSPGIAEAGTADPASDIPEEWRAQVQGELNNRRVNSDHQYNRQLLAGGRYSTLRV